MTCALSMYQFFINSSEDINEFDLTGFVHKFCDQFGFCNCEYCGIAFPNHNIDDNYLITTYNESWLSSYTSAERRDINPVISYGSHALLLFDWDDVPRDNKISERFFAEAIEFGIGTRGLTVPVRGPLGDVALFTVNANCSFQVWSKRRLAMAPDLTHFAYLFHNAIVSRVNKKITSHIPNLSKREVEVLLWASKGKTAWETAKILNLSEATVSYYLRNTFSKLNVKNKNQAISRFISKKYFQ
jgi:DNA-binding CsgD family transcriptional regulator